MVNWNLRTYSAEEFTLAWETASSLSQCAASLGLVRNGGSYKSLRSAARELGLTEDHMARQFQRTSGTRGAYKIPLKDILVEDSMWAASSGLRKRLLNEGVLAPICVGCGISEAYNFETGNVEPVPFHLDHINGVNTDNRLSNLRILCPTCHSFTATYAGKNRNKVKPNYCGCGQKIDRKSKKCQSCRNMEPTVLSTLSTDEIVSFVVSTGYSNAAKTYGVSDNTIRKELVRRGAPLPKVKRGPSKGSS